MIHRPIILMGVQAATAIIENDRETVEISRTNAECAAQSFTANPLLLLPLALVLKVGSISGPNYVSVKIAHQILYKYLIGVKHSKRHNYSYLDWKWTLRSISGIFLKGMNDSSNLSN